MVMAEEGLRQDNGALVSDSGGRLETGIGCMNELLPQMMVGRTYRAIAAGKFMAEDEGAARSWYAVAVEVDSTFDYGIEDLPEVHELRTVYNDLKIAYVPGPELVEERTLKEGEGVAHYLDGRKISTPEAVQARPHLYQLKDGSGVHSWVIKGNKFPDEGLFDPSAVPEEKGKKKKGPKEKAPELVTNEFGFVARQRPGEKTPLLIGGVVTMLGAAGIYGYTFKTSADFDACLTQACLKEKRDLTNQMILISAGVLALGAATLTWGVMVDSNGNPVPVPGVRVKW